MADELAFVSPFLIIVMIGDVGVLRDQTGRMKLWATGMSRASLYQQPVDSFSICEYNHGLRPELEAENRSILFRPAQESNSELLL